MLLFPRILSAPSFEFLKNTNKLNINYNHLPGNLNYYRSSFQPFRPYFLSFHASFIVSVCVFYGLLKEILDEIEYKDNMAVKNLNNLGV